MNVRFAGLAAASVLLTLGLAACGTSNATSSKPSGTTSPKATKSQPPKCPENAEPIPGTDACAPKPPTLREGGSVTFETTDLAMGNGDGSTAKVKLTLQRLDHLTVIQDPYDEATKAKPENGQFLCMQVKVQNLSRTHEAAGWGQGGWGWVGDDGRQLDIPITLMTGCDYAGMDGDDVSTADIGPGNYVTGWMLVDVPDENGTLTHYDQASELFTLDYDAA